jgi:hypothetical protein
VTAEIEMNEKDSKPEEEEQVVDEEDERPSEKRMHVQTNLN